MTESIDDLRQQFQKVSTELMSTIKRQQALDAQLKECNMVKDELDGLKDDEPVYKMHGRVLIRQDTNEARSTIAARLKLIQGELTKVEKGITTLQPQREEIINKIRDAQAKAAGKPQTP